MIPVIGFTGYIGSGKTEAAKYLAQHKGYTWIKFAQPLKDMLYAIGLNEREIEGDKKELPCKILGGKTPRFAMQTLGTEWGRKIMGEDFWVNIWERRCQEYISMPGQCIVADDCRFPNEVAAIRKLGGVIVRMDRPGRKSMSRHESESGIEYLPSDMCYMNDYPLQVMHNWIETMLLGNKQ